MRLSERVSIGWSTVTLLGFRNLLQVMVKPSFNSSCAYFAICVTCCALSHMYEFNWWLIILIADPLHGRIVIKVKNKCIENSEVNKLQTRQYLTHLTEVYKIKVRSSNSWIFQDIFVWFNCSWSLIFQNSCLHTYVLT